MLNENFNNLPWRNNLEDADGLSAEILPDKNAAWEKLQSRLGEKIKPKKFITYWAAAACLLLAILVPLILVYKKENNIVKNNTRTLETSKPAVEQMQPLKAGTVAVIHSVPATKKRAAKVELKNNNDTIAVTNTKRSETNIQIADNEVISPLPFADSSFIANVVTVHPKKKLKVVHINELGEPAEELPGTEHNTNLHYFQLKLANQEVYMSKSLTSGNTGVNLFTTKNSSSN